MATCAPYTLKGLHKTCISCLLKAPFTILTYQNRPCGTINGCGIRPLPLCNPFGYNRVGDVLLTQGGASLALGYIIQPFQGCITISSPNKLLGSQIIRHTSYHSTGTHYSDEPHFLKKITPPPFQSISSFTLHPSAFCPLSPVR